MRTKAKKIHANEKSNSFQINDRSQITLYGPTQINASFIIDVSDSATAATGTSTNTIGIRTRWGTTTTTTTPKKPFRSALFTLTTFIQVNF